MSIQLRGVQKTFGAQRVLDDCNLDIGQGQITTLLGPSGCGKTTLLRCIAGFHRPERGQIVMDGRDITWVPPNRRELGMVFQNYALFPHLSVADNVAYGLSVRKTPRAETKQRVDRALDVVSMTAFAGRYPSQLSGGQQQRVALARVLVLEPKALLLDEPFNALDAKLRLAMQVELRKLIKRLGITSIFVTHDQEEALTISDRVAVMRRGKIEQIDQPLALYDRPVNAYVADFIGSANLLPVFARAGKIDLMPGLSVRAERDGEAVLVIRPENLLISPHAATGIEVDRGWPGTINFIKPLGAIVEYEVDIGGERLLRAISMRHGDESNNFTVGSKVTVRLRDPDSCTVLPGPDER